MEKKIFDRHAIRDANDHHPLDLVPIHEARGRAFFDVDNDHDQQLTVEIVGSGVNDPAGAPLTGSTGTIAANTRRSVVTDIWAPWLGLVARYSTPPTTGSLTIEGHAE